MDPVRRMESASPVNGSSLPTVIAPPRTRARPAPGAPPRSVRGRSAAALRGALRAERPDGQLRLVYALWFTILFDWQFFLAEHGLGPIVRVPLILVALLAFSMVLDPHPPADWLWGIMAWVGATAINLPWAYNRGNIMPILRAMILYYLVALGVMKSVKTPRQAIAIFFLLCVGQYLWWGVMGIKDGMVTWHPNLANFDGYGPLMVIGVGPAYFYGMSVPKGRRRNLAFFASALCVIGVVSAFARGSTLTLVVTVAHIWLRSPRKGRTAGILAVGFALVLIASSLIDGSTRGDDTKSNFWEEMGTMFDDSNGSTGSDRETLWAAATIVFKAHPVLGVGAENFGPAAVTLIKPGDIPGAAWDSNPYQLYARALHSNYYQLASEYGILGFTVLGFLLYQFWKRGREIRRLGDAATWRAAGGIEDPRMLAIGLEVGMGAYLVSGFFYNQLFTSWLFSYVIANTLLYTLVMKQHQQQQQQPKQPKQPAPTRKRVLARPT